MTYEVIILGHLHMPLYFIGTFTEYPYFSIAIGAVAELQCQIYFFRHTR